MAESEDLSDAAKPAQPLRPRPLQPAFDRPAATSQRPARPTPATQPQDAVTQPAPAIVDYSANSTVSSAGRLSVQFRRTLIPPSLVFGIGCIAGGAGFFLQSPQSALRHVDVSIPIVTICLGAASLVTSVITMMSVRRDLARRSEVGAS